MQVIAGVHFNWSLPERFWPVYRQALGSGLSPDTLRDRHYMGQVRNLLRHGWIVPYLFGASPAVCRSFFPHGESRLPRFDEHTYFEPHATSLRMGDIGYQNSREKSMGIRPCYGSVGSYADALLKAITTPAGLWEEIGVKVNGEYRQLNANILQIENEYYSSVRPKQLAEGLESPALALKKRGVRYIELRSLDVNVYHPLGVDGTQLYFLEAFLLLCLFADSPPLDTSEQEAVNDNLLRVAHRGREPGLVLGRVDGWVPLSTWGREILDAMLPVCEFLDHLHGVEEYGKALHRQLEKIIAPERTPSARMLREMSDKGESFYQLARRWSMRYDDFFRTRKLSPQREQEFAAEVVRSLAVQQAIEAAPQAAFDQFLADYFAPTCAAVG